MKLDRNLTKTLVAAAGRSRKGMLIRRRWAIASAALTVAAGLGLAATTPAHADGPEQTIFDNIRNSSTEVWQGWEPPVQPPGNIVTYPDDSTDTLADSTHVDVVTTNGLYDIARDSNGQWSKWEPPPQPLCTPSSDPGGNTYQIYSASEPNGSIDFYQICAGWIDESVRYASGSWTEWYAEESVPAGTTSLAVTASGASDIDQVMALTSTGAIWHATNNFGVWQKWEPPAQVPGGAVSIAAAGLGNDNTEFIAISTNGYVYHTIRHADGSWAVWAKPIQPLPDWYEDVQAPLISAAADYNGNAQFVIWAVNELSGMTDMFHIIRYANGDWQTDGWLEPWMPPGRCYGTTTINTYDPSDTNLHLDAVCNATG
jgi:hypothetical protein